MFRISPDRHHECRDAASQTLPMEVFGNNNGNNNKFNNLGGGSSGSIRSSSSAARGETPSTVVRNRNQKAYDYRRMTESLWSPPPLTTSRSGLAPFGSDDRGTEECSGMMSVGKDGGHLWNRKTIMHQQTEGGGRGGRRETVTSNEGRTMSSVCDGSI